MQGGCPIDRTNSTGYQDGASTSDQQNDISLQFFFRPANAGDSNKYRFKVQEGRPRKLRVHEYTFRNACRVIAASFSTPSKALPQQG